jgi:hypothetical protein
MSVPPYMDGIIPLSSEEWQNIVDQSAHNWEENAYKAYVCRRRADDLRQAAEVWADYGAAYDRKAAENHKDGANVKQFVSFLGIEVAPMHETDVQLGDNSVVLDRVRMSGLESRAHYLHHMQFFAEIPHSGPPPEQDSLGHELRDGESFDETPLDHRRAVVKRTSLDLALDEGKIPRLVSTLLSLADARCTETRVVDVYGASAVGRTTRGGRTHLLDGQANSANRQYLCRSHNKYGACGHSACPFWIAGSRSTSPGAQTTSRVRQILPSFQTASDISVGR